LHGVAFPVRHRDNVRGAGPVSRAKREERRLMSENVDKVNEGSAPRGEMGQRYLASGESVSMRLWDGEEPGDPKPEAARSYETVGYVIEGRAELRLGGETIPLAAGDSWTVPKGASHTYVILELFTAVEATSPPAEAQGRDEP
jgi:quercetin dioxygenase-like cupin family protein